MSEYRPLCLSSSCWEWTNEYDARRLPWGLPSSLFDLLSSGEYRTGRSGTGGCGVRTYRSKDEALADLQIARDRVT